MRISSCSDCKHKRKNIGFQMACDAFPNGIPYEFDDDKVESLDECNNGIKYEKNEEK